MAKEKNGPPKFPEIGARLSQFVKDSGEPSARQFALKAGITPAVLSNLMLGYSIPGGETLAALAAAYPKFDVNHVLTGKCAIIAPHYPSAQLPPQVPSKLEPPQAPEIPASPSPEQWRENMRIVAESAELREVKSERDNLRKTNEQLLAIIRNFSGGATDAPAAAGGSGKADASSYAADLRETVDELIEEYPLDYRIVAVKRIGFSPSHLRIA